MNPAPRNAPPSGIQAPVTDSGTPLVIPAIANPAPTSVNHTTAAVLGSRRRALAAATEFRVSWGM